MNAPAIDFSVLIGILYEKMVNAMSFLFAIDVPENNISLFGSAQPINPLSQTAQAVSAAGQYTDTTKEYFDILERNADIAAQTSSNGFIAEIAPQVWDSVQLLSYILILLFAILIVYVIVRKSQILIQSDEEISKEGMMFYRNIDGFSNQTTVQDVHSVRRRWNAIVGYANSENPNDWRHAIIDADIMLDEMLDAQGYKGATMGEKMKQVERSDFNTIDMAWEAHKMRNRIAHEGSNQALSERLVRQTIGQYQSVFREFELI